MQENNRDEILPSEVSLNEIHRIIKNKVHRIDREFTEAFEFISKFEKSVTFFGSARFKENDEHYKKARALAKRIATELDYAILTGGGGGIMEAGNRGAFEAGKTSVGLNIYLQNLNSYTTHSMRFYYFFIRKVALSFSAETYLFFPGGFGTLDEFFEIVTLIQTKKIHKVPIILVGRDFWSPLKDLIKKVLYEEHQTIDKDDMDLYTITDNEDEIIELIRQTPVRRIGTTTGQWLTK